MAYFPDLIPNKKYIACIGDSITFGYGVWSKRDKQSFPALLEKKTNFVYQFVNYGLPGRCLMKETSDPFSNDEYYETSLKINAETYLILLGTNDAVSFNWNIEGNESGELFKKDLEEFVLSYLNLKHHPKVVLMTPPDAIYSDDKEELIILQNNLEKYVRPIIKEVAQKYHLLCIDLYPLTKDKKEYFDDGIHPNLLGNELIAELIYQELKKSLIIID